MAFLTQTPPIALGSPFFDKLVLLAKAYPFGSASSFFSSVFISSFQIHIESSSKPILPLLITPLNQRLPLESVIIPRMSFHRSTPEISTADAPCRDHKGICQLLTERCRSYRSYKYIPFTYYQSLRNSYNVHTESMKNFDEGYLSCRKIYLIYHDILLT